MIYLTTTGRSLLTDTNLEYAADENKRICFERIKEEHKSTIAETPTEKIAQFFEKANEYLPYTDMRPTGANLISSLEKTAQLAAEVHQKCLEVSPRNQISSAYTHIYRTDKKRFALSCHSLTYACSPDNPAITCEESITPEDMNATIFASDLTLLTFIANACGVQFYSPDCATTNAVHHNCIILQRGADSGYECVVRDVNGYVPLNQLLKEEKNESVLQMYLGASLYQIALCNLYLAQARAA